MVQKSEPNIRRAVPFALAIISLSNPKNKVVDLLSRLTHDEDLRVVINSIFALGLVAAGTNNGKVAALLRQLAVYHAKDENLLFMVRISQGLVHLGKGLLTLNPYHCDGKVLDKALKATLSRTFPSQ